MTKPKKEKEILIEWMGPTKIGTEEKKVGTRDLYPEKEANQYINLGWAKNVETGFQGERVPGSTPLSVDSLKIKTS